MPVTDLGALRDAVSRLKNLRGVDCSLVENARPRMYYERQQVPCDFVLKLHKSEYDVGFQKQADGSYLAIFDEWADHVGKELAVKTCPAPGTAEEGALRAIGMFSQEYARCSSINAMASSGYYVESEGQDEKGNYHVEFAEAA